MKIFNKWRWVSYSNDGCDIYQCLRCKKFWDSRTSPEKTIVGFDGAEYHCDGFKFCGFCGTKWDGEHVWNKEEDRIDVVATFENKYWVIESKLKNSCDEFSQHDYFSLQLNQLSGAKKVLDHLKSYRKENYRLDYRVVISNKALYKYPVQISFKKYYEDYLKEWGGKRHFSNADVPRRWVRKRNLCQQDVTSVT